jgi:hypothetical protein
LVAFASGLAFAAAVPAAALAGIDTVPVVLQPAAAPVCADAARDHAADFVVVTCKKKAQTTKTTLCQQLLVVIPDIAQDRAGIFAHPVPGCRAMHVAVAEPEGPTDPPRG